MTKFLAWVCIALAGVPGMARSATIPSVSGNLTINACSMQPGATQCYTSVVAQMSGNYANCVWLLGPTELVGCNVGTQYLYAWATTTPRTIELRRTATIYPEVSDEARQSGALLDTDVLRVIPPNVLPSVSLTSPAASSSHLGGQPIVVSANASDSDGTIVKVDFYDGETLIATDTTAPYSYTWTGVSSGSHGLRAVATDSAGGAASSATVTISVNYAPSVGLTGPQSGTVVHQGNGTTLTAVASDPDSAIARVEFHANGALLGQDTVAPYAFTWSPVPPGTHSVTARVLDIQGATGTSSAITIIGNQAPTVAMSSPGNGAAYLTGQTIALAANASDGDGGVAAVEFLDGETVLATDTTAPYAFNWANAAQGTHVLTARATDNYGSWRLSAGVTINVNQHPPSVSMTAPANGSVVHQGQPITATASASDPDGGVARVEFYANGSIAIGTDTTAPFSVTWFNAPTGTHSIRAYAVDTAGAATTSAATSVTVNALPAVSVTAPANGAVVAAGQSVTVSANASDSDGSIAQVDFYAGTSLLGSDTTSPYSISVATVPAGTYSVTARATDNRGGTTTSSAISVRVNAVPTVSMTAPTNGAVVVQGNPTSLAATTADSDGNVVKVEFYDGTTLIAVDTVVPWQLAYPAVPGGTRSLTAKAYDNDGGIGTSAAVTITGNQLPTVALASPAGGASFVAGQTITLSATASDADGSIASVTFRDGDTVLHTDTASPFDYAWNGATVGPHSIKAVATDDRGATRESAVAAISVTHTPPTISITSPAVGAYYQVNQPIPISVNASAAAGVASVTFYAGAQLLGTDVSEPYGLVWNTTTVGTHVLKAVVSDANNVGAEATRSVIVNAPPTVGYTAPAADTVHALGTPITLAADASDSDGTIARVEFRAGETLLASDTTAPYTYTWTDAPVGTHLLTVTAVDNRTRSTTSPGPQIVVNRAPFVGIQSPVDDSAATVDTTVEIRAIASDDDGGRVTKVEFFVDDAYIGQDVNAPYTVQWERVTSGAHRIKAVATDDSGLKTTSATNDVFGNRLPSASMTAPLANDSFRADVPVPMTVTASDPDGPIAQVAFFDGNTLLGVDDSADGGWTFSATGLAIGDHALQARVYDAHNAWRDSNIVPIKVTSLAPTVRLVKPTEGQALLAGTRVRFQAEAMDVDSGMAGVTFNVDGMRLPIMNPPDGDEADPGHNGVYFFDWEAPNTGTYRVSATAIDLHEVEATTAEVRFRVHRAPSAGIHAPIDRTRTEPGQPIEIRVEAHDDSSVAMIRLEFGEEARNFSGAELTPCPNAPTHVCVSHVWSNPPLGLHLIELTVTDSDQVKSVRSVRAPVGVPDFTTRLTSPVAGPRGRGPITLAATTVGASDVAYVEFEDYGNVIPGSRDHTAPYEFVLTNPTIGPHRFVAVAHSAHFGDEPSEAVQVTVEDRDENQPPFATLLQPQAGTFQLGAIALRASATDADGSISRVDFIVTQNGATIATIAAPEDAATPGQYAGSWTPALTGTYQIVARAYDNATPPLTDDSDPVTITVGSGTALDHEVPASIPASIHPSSDGVGATAGEFRVDESGAATYTIPLATVPGRAGVAPQLALGYGSQGGYGPLGRGWSLTGASAITRCRQTVEHGDLNATQNGSAPIGFDEQDRFCLDGQRLLLVGGDEYGADGSEYRTEIDTFARIRAYDPDHTHGPNYFVVQRKDGTTAWYGDRIAATNLPFMRAGTPEIVRNDAVVLRNDGSGAGDGPAASSAPVLTWAMSRSMDSFGNHIDFDYTTRQNLGEQLLAAVRYTGKTQLAGQTLGDQSTFASVEFAYENLPDGDPATEVDERAFGYASGMVVARTRYLASITSKSGATPIRHYKLGYGTTASGSNERILTQLTECASAAAGAVCYRPTVFGWSQARHELREEPRIDETQTLKDLMSSKLGDVDGDGLLDFVWFQNVEMDDFPGDCGTQRVRVRFGTISGGRFSWPSSTDRSPGLCSPRSYKEELGDSWHLLDYNGDGRDDLLIAGPSWKPGDTIVGGASGQHWRVHLSLGRDGVTASFDSANQLPDCAANRADCILVGENAALAQLADFNGDGLPDLLYGGAAAGRQVATPPKIRFASRTSAGSFVFGAEHDVRADWVDDKCTRTIATGQELLGEGTHFLGCRILVDGSSSRLGKTPRPVDFDGDGRSDLLANVDAVSEVTCTDAGGCAGTGNYFVHEHLLYQLTVNRIVAASGSTPAYVELSAYGYTPNGQRTTQSPPVGQRTYDATTADVNGDGLQDTILLPVGSTTGRVEVRVNRGPGSLAYPGTGYDLTGRDHLNVVDANGDGRADLVFPSVDGTNRGKWLVRHALPDARFASTSASLITCANPMAADDNCHKTMGRWLNYFADLDGDGALDYASLLAMRDGTSQDREFDSARAISGSRYAPRDVLTTITNGYGATTSIRYQPLTNGAVYQRGAGARAMRYGRHSAVHDVLGAMYVVSAVESDAPAIGHESRRSAVYYQYRGARMQGGGRGMLGFEEIRTTDANFGSPHDGRFNDRHVVTITKYSQAFPHIGTPLETWKYLVEATYVLPGCVTGGPEAAPAECFTANGVGSWHDDPTGRLISYARNRVDSIETAPDAARSPVHAFIRASFEASGNVDVAGPETLSETTTYFNFDALGNADVNEVGTAVGRAYTTVGEIGAVAKNRLDATTAGGRCGPACLSQTETLAEFEPADLDYWRLGRLSLSTVTHKRFGKPAIVRATEFTYDLDSPARTGALVSERLQKDVAGQDLRTVRFRDDYGNVTTTLSCSGDIAEADCDDALDVSKVRQRPVGAGDQPLESVFRYSRTVFDATGRFANETLAPYFLESAPNQANEAFTSKTTSRDLLGNALRSESPNNLWSTATFGPLGRQTGSADVLGAANATEFHWCTGINGGIREAACPQGAVFRQTSHARGGARSVGYFDRLGRPMIAVAESFNRYDSDTSNDWVATCTIYDQRGRTIAASEPFFVPVDDQGVVPGLAHSTPCTSVAATRTWYDNFDRAVDIQLPEHRPGAPAQTVTEYLGLTATTKTQISRDETGDLIPDAVTMQQVTVKDATGLVLTVTDHAGLVATYDYDSTGNVRTISRSADATRGNVVSTVEYDALGRKIVQGDPDAGISTTSYNAVGEVVCTSDARGVRTVVDYDAMGRAWRSRAEPGTCSTTRDVVTLTDAAALASAVELGASRQVDVTLFDSAANGRGLPASVTRRHTTGTGYAVVERWRQANVYDTRGRATSVTTTFKAANAANDSSYTQSTTYDALGRVATTTDATGGVVENMYGSHGFLRRVRDGAQPSLVYWELIATDARGQATMDQRHGNVKLTTHRRYESQTGRLQAIRTGVRQGVDVVNAIQDLEYDFDAQGNLVWRHDQRLQFKEHFRYDRLNRLVHGEIRSTANTTQAPVTSISLTYDKLGNICSKNGRAYSYAGRAGCGAGGLPGVGANTDASPHAATQRATANGFVTYGYDAAGYQTLADDSSGTASDRTVRYDVNGLADRIVVGGGVAETQFRYAPGGRYQRIDIEGGNTTVTRYLGGVEWITKQDGTSQRKRYVGGFLVLTETGPTATPSREYRYILTDHLGSLDVLADENGNVVERLSFDAHGSRRAVEGPGAWQQLLPSYMPQTTNRGFTGHEQVDRAGIVHMNGRLYDAALGRMLSPDPVVQEPFNAQNLNRYSYVLNNPLSFTDPTGLNFVKKYWRAIAAAAITIFAPYLGPWVSTWYGAVAVGFVSGAVASGSLQGGLYGAFSAGLFYGIGSAFSNVGGQAGTGVWGTGLSGGQFAGKVLAHATAGGVMSSLQGGKFGHGFVSAGVTQALSPAIDHIDAGGAPARIAAAALLGGTTSVLTGGKFANGAITAAFSRAFNDEVHNDVPWPGDGDYDVNDPSYHRYTEANAICSIDQSGCSVELVGALMLNAFNAPSFMLLPQAASADGVRLLFATPNPGLGLSPSYILPGGVIRQDVHPAKFAVTNRTTIVHPLHNGHIHRIVVQSGGKVWVVTHGAGINVPGNAIDGMYGTRVMGPAGGFVNHQGGLLMFRDQDTQLRRAWRMGTGNW